MNYKTIAALILTISSTTAFAAGVFVDTKWLDRHQRDPNIVIVDMSSDYAQYQRFHIPNSIYLPYDALIKQQKNGVALAVDSQRFADILGQIGISPESHVIVYDDLAGLNASRLFWQMDQIGHKDISILDGGLVKWIHEQRPVTGLGTSPKRTRYVITNKPVDNLAEIGDINRALTDRDSLLVDARSSEEYIGDPRQPKTGHIPGAIHLAWDSSVDFGNGFTLLGRDRLVQNLHTAGLGASKDQAIITYCQSGHRAGYVYLTLRELGYRNVRVYDGSIAEYTLSAQPALSLGNKP